MKSRCPPLLLVAALMLVGLSGEGCMDSTDNGDSDQRGANQQGGSGQGSGGSGSGGPELSSSQERALRSAQNSVDREGSSPLGLIQHLRYDEGFSKADAKFAVDHVRANWEEEAVGSAQERVDATDGYSPTSLIQHLVWESGFTKADARSAVYLHVDVDWGLEAWEAAARLLRDGDGFTESELVEQLESGGFTAVDAQYAVDKVSTDERTRDLLEGDL
jgi:Host cell surface-exposed lipoprotein